MKRVATLETMVANREYYNSLLSDISWKEIFLALGLGYRRDRGNKFISSDVCSECGYEETVVGRPNGTFVCRKCGDCGDKVEYILRESENEEDYWELEDEERLRRIIFSIEDPRQRRLFPKEKLKLYWV